MNKKALVAVAALAVMMYSVSAFAAAGTCQDWKGVWEFTYDNTTATTFCFDNSSKIDNGTIVACVDNGTLEDNCTCITNIDPDNASLGIDNSTFEECDNNSAQDCIFVKNPVYKKTTAKGKQEVIITDVKENYSAGPIKELCFATGKRGTQAITISQPDNATLANAAYKEKYFSNVKPGMYLVQEGGGQTVADAPFTRIAKAKFTSDNFTVDNSTLWNIPGLTKGEFVRELTCEDLDNCTDDNVTAACELKMIPKRIFKLTSFVNPIIPFVITAPKATGVEFARPVKVTFSTEAITSPIALKITKRLILGLMIKRPFKLESDNYTADVTYGDNGTGCADFAVK